MLAIKTRQRFSQVDLAWAAGFFDGEGSVSNRYNRSKTYQVGYPRLSICQNTRIPLDRFCHIVKVGKVYGPYQYGTGNPRHEYGCSNWANVQYIMAALWRYLSQPKRNQFDRTMAEFANTRRIRKMALHTHGKKGKAKKGKKGK